MRLDRRSCGVPLNDSAGFTLIEIMIALAILAALSLLTAQAIRSGIANKIMLQGDISRETTVTDALKIIRTDLSAAFHHRDIAVTMYNEIVAPPTAPQDDANQGQPGQTDQTGQVNPQDPPPPPPAAPNQATQPLGTPRPTPVPLTAFVGDAESVHFTTVSHSRTVKDAKESDQAKVGYFVKPCNSHRDKKPRATRCLFRSESTILDTEITTPGPSSLLVEDVEEFALRYLGPDKDDYVEAWNSQGNGDESMKDNFPYAVEVTLTVHNKADKKEKPFSQTILVPIVFPNNPEKN